MWLPKDERRLLQGYYINIGQYDNEKNFHIMAWAPVIKSEFIKRNARRVKSIGESEQVAQASAGYKDMIEKMTQILKDEKVITETNKMLEARRLITLRGDRTTSNIVGITLTLDGYDLGREYNYWWTRSKLWYDEYIKGHWIWLFICFIVGGVITQLINYLLKTLGAK